MDLATNVHWQDAKVRLFVLTPELVTEAYVQWLNDPQINRFLESRFAVADMESTRAFVRSAQANPNVLFLGIHSLELGRHVGNIKLGPIDRHHLLGDIGIMIGDRAAWNKGIASAAIKLLTGIAREQLALRKLTAGCYASNISSALAFQKCGFAIEGSRPAHFLLDGHPEDLVLMGRLVVDQH